MLLSKGHIQKILTMDLVNLVLPPFTPLPLMGLVNKIIMKIGEVFTPPLPLVRIGKSDKRIGGLNKQFFEVFPVLTLSPEPQQCKDSLQKK